MNEKIYKQLFNNTYNNQNLPVSIIRPVEWLVMWVSVIGLVIFIIWGIWGTITTRTHLNGIIINDGDKMKIIGFVDVAWSRKIKPDQPALIELNHLEIEDSGRLQGVVRSISASPIPTRQITSMIMNEDLVNYLLQTKLPYLVEIDMVKAGDSGQYQWTSNNNRDNLVKEGGLVNIAIEINQIHPVKFIIPHW